MPSATVIGSTGLVGSHFIKLLALEPISSLKTIARRPLDPTLFVSKHGSEFEMITDSGSASWPTKLFGTGEQSEAVGPDVFEKPNKVLFSSLGITKAAAGSLEAQRAVDHDLTLSIAQAGITSGVDSYVLVSSTHASPNSHLGAYLKLKGETERDILALNFPGRVVILRPAILLGEREGQYTKSAKEGLLSKVGSALQHWTGGALSDSWSQDAEYVARAGIRAGLGQIWRAHGEGLQGDSEEMKRVWIMSGHEIIKYGKPEKSTGPGLG